MSRRVLNRTTGSSAVQVIQWQRLLNYANYMDVKMALFVPTPHAQAQAVPVKLQVVDHTMLAMLA